VERTTRIGCHAHARVAIASELRQRGAQAPGAGRLGFRGHDDPVDPVADRVPHPRAVDRDGRQAGGQRLRQHEALGLGARREDEQVSPIQPRQRIGM
jgi:hypothetical protein